MIPERYNVIVRKFKVAFLWFYRTVAINFLPHGKTYKLYRGLRRRQAAVNESDNDIVNFATGTIVICLD